MSRECIGSAKGVVAIAFVWAVMSAVACSGEGTPRGQVAGRIYAFSGGITVQGVVINEASQPQSGVAVEFTPVAVAGVDAAVPGPVTTMPDGTYSVDIASGTYDVTATPPLSSIYLQQKFPGRIFSSTTTFDIVLLQTGVLVSGKVSTSDGTPLAAQSVSIGSSYVQTDGAGNYALSAVPGNVNVSVNSGMGV
jgi:hypothetical protein